MPSEVVNLQVNAVGNFSNVIGEVNKLRSSLQNLKLPKGMSENLTKGFDDLEAKVNKFQSIAAKGVKTKADYNELTKAAKEVDTATKLIEKNINSISAKKIKLNMTDTPEIRKKIEELERFKKEAAEALNFKKLNTADASGIFNIAAIEKIQNTLNKGTAGAKNLQNVLNSFKSGNIDQVSAALEKLVSYAKQYETTLNDSGGNKRGTELLAWAREAQAAISGADSKIKEFNADIKQMRADEFNKMASGVENFKSQFSGAASSIRQTTQEMRNMAASSMDMHSQLGMLQTQANYFFGLQNMFNLFRRNIEETFNTVKELDKAMTETAVVTDFSVSDMWKELPRYTQTANELGATIKGAYETMTLYYQQGLSTEEAFAVGTETMKMARIAGLDYAQTTNMMTAALRGFNMEINEVSAQRVNDVYSKLAAITASDTRELGLAMERTASIAHSANMDFGNTTAFLAQMIETTREAPENLGTAMKTIIARFQELKENPYEISEVEGEEVDFNRIDKALKTIGVDLMDNRDKFRDLDDVFMDISEKWDSLSQTQQRYIATMAAGSRQQSRFLAMVGNYDRLKQLTEAAANSEGAADVQFAKTLDSMEAKLNKLRNAWDQFAMGIANNKLLKGAVDKGVKALDIVNDIEDSIEKWSGGFDTWTGSIAKSITSLTALWAAFKIGGKIINTSIGLLGGFLGVMPKGGLLSGISGRKAAANQMQAAAISNPIVSAIHSAANMLANKNAQTFKGVNGINKKGYSDFRDTQRSLRFMSISRDKQVDPLTGKSKVKKTVTPSTFNTKQVYSLIKDYSPELQRALLQQVPGTQSALQRSWEQACKNVNLDKSAQDSVKNYLTSLRRGMNNGQYTPEAVLKTAANPLLLGTAMKASGEEAGQILMDSTLAKIKEIKQATLTQMGIVDPKKMTKDQGNQYKKLFEKNIKKAGISNVGTKLTLDELSANKWAGVTSGATAAGQAVMNFGMALDGLGLHGIGSLLTNIGSTFMSIGMSASGAVSGVMALGEAMGMAGASMGTILASAAPFLAIAAAITAAGIAVGVGIKKQKDLVKKAQKEAKKVTDDYNKIIEKTSKNINKLEENREDFATLSKGVDENGNNVSLGTEEYADYLKIVNEIAKMHPELVKGYNAHGRAILNNNKVINEAVSAEEKYREAAEKTYASEKSLDKLIVGRNTTKRWKIGQDEEDSTRHGRARGVKRKGEESQLKKDSQKVIDSIKKLEDGDKLLKQLESDFHLKEGALSELTNEGIKAIQEHGDAFDNVIKSKYGNITDETTKNLLTSIQNGIAKVGTDTKGIEEVTQPIYAALSTYASQNKLFDSIPEQFKDVAEQGLKDISKLSYDDNGELISGEAMQRKVRMFGNELSNMNGHAEEYQNILQNIQQAEEEFSNNLNKNDYLNNNKIKDAISSLEKWAAEARQKGDETSKLLAETFENQIEQIKNFAEEGNISISDALNTMSDEIAAAEGSLESFNKTAEGSNFSTAAENMKSIYDTISELDSETGKNKHAEGKGDQTYWAGAEALLGRENLEKEAKKNTESLKKETDKMLKTIEPMLQEGEAGFDAFKEHWFDAFDAGKLKDISGLKLYDNGWFKTIDDTINPEVYQEVASALGMSEDFLVSMLNKGRQFAGINFDNLKQVRESLATSDSVIEGTKSKKGKKNLYIKEDTLNAELSSAGIVDVGAQEKEKERLRSEQNIHTITEAAKIGINEFHDMGIKTQEELIAAFDATGQFSKEEIKDYAESFAKLNDEKFNNKEFNDDYSAYLDSLDTGTATLQSIDSTVAAIAAAVVNNRIEQGYLDNPKANEFKKKLFGEKGDDTQADYFAKGLNTDGEKLSKKEYQEARADLNQSLIELEEYQNHLEKGLKKAKTDEEKDKFKKELETTDKLIEGVKTKLKEGAEAYSRDQITDEERKKHKKPKGAHRPSRIGEDENDEFEENKPPITHRPAVKGGMASTTEGGNQPISKFFSGLIGKFQEWKQKTDKASEPSSKSSDEEQKNIWELLSSYLRKKESESPEETPSKSKKDFSLFDGFEDFGNLFENGKVAAKANTAFEPVFNSIKEKFKNLFIGEDGTFEIPIPKISEGFSSTINSIKEKIKSLFTTNEDGTFEIPTPKISEGFSSTINSIKEKIKSLFTTTKEGTTFELPAPTIGGNFTGVIERAKSLIKKIFSNEGETFELPTPKIGAGFTGIINKAKGLIKKIFSSDGNEGEQKPQPKKEKQSQDSKVANNITLKSKVTNPKEPKEKIEKAIPKKIKKDVPVTINTTTKTKEQKPKEEDGHKKNKKAVNVEKTQVIKVKADTGAAEKKVNALIKKFNKTYTLKYRASGPDHISVPISANFTGSWTKTVQIKKSDAKGQNNFIQHQLIPSAGSAAKGFRYGTVGPKNRGGLTLTGEKGFEIAWLPSQNRSMILGAKGPQMVNLPPDAVVWTNEQSKKIMKQKAIPAGSHYSSSEKVSRSNRRTTSGGSYNGSKRRGGNSSNSDGGSKKNTKKAAKVIEKAGKINTWWWNMTKKVEATQRRIDKISKTIEKLLKKVGTTLESIKEQTAGYIKDLRRQITYNEQMKGKAQDKLDELDTGKESSSKKVKKLNKKLKKAQKKGSKKQVKKLKKQIKKAKKGENYSNITYDVYKKKGKKKEKKTKKARVNLKDFIYYDEESETYQVDYNAINAKYSNNKSKAKAIAEAAKKKVEKWEGKKNTAEDNIDKVDEALEQLGQDLYETFFGWKVELTKIWNITQQIEEITSRISRVEAFQDLLDAQVASGMAEVTADFVNEYLETFQKKTVATVQKIQAQMQAIEIGKIELADLYNIDSNKEAIELFTGKTTATDKIIESIDKAQIESDKASDKAAEKKAAYDAAKKAKKKAKGKKAKKKAQTKVNKARKAKDNAADAAKTAKDNLDALQEDYTTGIESGKYYDDTDQLAYKAYLKELEADRTARQKTREFADIKTNADGTLSVNFDTQKFIEARQRGEINSETAQRIQEYVQSIVDQTNELNQAYAEATNLLAEQYNALKELDDQWAEYGEQLLTWYEDEQKEDLDRLKALADSIDKSLKDLLDKVKKDLDRRRQLEDNTKKEQSISKKQQRLAALRSNTGGGNQVEIAQLQKEIADEQQEYLRTLEDQLLERLNDQAELAAKQRERQIELQEAILQATNNAAEVNKWMDDPEKYKDEIRQAFYSKEDYDNLTKAQQEKLDNEFETLYLGLLTNRDNKNSVQAAINDTKDYINQIKESLANFPAEIAKLLNGSDDGEPEDGEPEDGGSEDSGYDGHPVGGHKPEQQIIDISEVREKYDNFLTNRGSSKSKDKNKGKLGEEGLKDQLDRGGKLGLDEVDVLQDLADTDELTWEDVLKAFIKVKGKSTADEIIKKYFGKNPTSPREKGYKAAFNKAYKYASGGLNTQTGPAWLDGTPSKPELVLNAQDTKNFMALRDVLSDVMGVVNTTANTSTNTLYEININVDHINNDYDVDKIAERVKKDIVKGAGYRNVTQVRNFR